MAPVSKQSHVETLKLEIEQDVRLGLPVPKSQLLLKELYSLGSCKTTVNIVLKKTQHNIKNSYEREAKSKSF